MQISYPLLQSNITCPRSQMSNCNSHGGSTPALKPIQPSIQWVLQLFSGVNFHSTNLTTYFYWVLKLRMHGAMHLCHHASLSSK